MIKLLNIKLLNKIKKYDTTNCSSYYEANDFVAQERQNHGMNIYFTPNELQLANIYKDFSILKKIFKILKYSRCLFNFDSPTQQINSCFL